MIKIDKWFLKKLLKTKDINYKLTMIFGFFVLFPILGFIFFGVKYNVLDDEFVPLFFIGVLVFSLFGFSVFRSLFAEIKNISEEISLKYIDGITDKKLQTDTDELHKIVLSFKAVENQFFNTSSQLQKRSSELSALKELSELYYVTVDPMEILYVMLERSLILTNSDIGSVMIMDRNQSSFIVKASIGAGDFIKIDDKIDFKTSIAKYAVINKSPIVVEDIEKDSRFGRINRPQYASKSFVCMPIKTSKDIVGVLTISRKKDDKVFTQEDVEALIPLLSSAAFTYENLRLMGENEQKGLSLKAIEKIFKVINSSFRNSELLHAVLNEIQSIVPFDIAVVMIKAENTSNYITIFDLLANEHTSIIKGSQYFYQQGSVIDNALKQDATIIIEDTSVLSSEVEKKLFLDQGCKSCILAPLKMDGVVKGILALYAKKPDTFYDAQELIEWMANALSIAIERNRLSKSVIKRNKELDSIKQIGNALASSTFDVNKVLEYTMDMIRVIMDVEAGSLYLVNDEELEFTVGFNVKVEPIKKLQLKVGQGIAGYAAARGESITINDVQKSPHFDSEIDEATGFKTLSALCVPMISKGKVIGVLEVLNKIKGDFSTSDGDLLKSIASSVSIAIENARLYKETVSMAKHERSIRNMFQQFVPKEVVDKIIHDSEIGETTIEELKTITLLNIDIRGFSGLVRKIGPHKMVTLLNHFFSVMGGIVFKHKGIVDKYLGDGLLALFGVPVSSTRDADNAVSAALEMKKSISPLSDYFLKELGFAVSIGISIHTGEVVVGNFGFERKMDYTVIGDPVNDVFRLQTLTKSFPNGILISENACRSARSRLELRDVEATLGELKIYELLDLKKDIK
ncbi:MAG: GAF domain-containing protein [Proteobacteria bacterium]|nr:GAF domain-containing protein [Pseudomonadota bacterium]MBU4067790.1 GAF domain-containing protein [Pseudomonadota bacterium]MBU4101988.1 GAF domain-containing protein [Pseudomonadota bacterium]MBU4126978.1 GAF domain-containing protein [Pseudomonadota bacterium]MBU4209350.1 GAF domain-containing protein [Pseudomonadota bacterium]